MKETKVYCDHCKKEFDTRNGYEDLDIEVNHLWFRTDLCSECHKILFNMCKDFCNKEIEQ